MIISFDFAVLGGDQKSFLSLETKKLVPGEVTCPMPYSKYWGE